MRVITPISKLNALLKNKITNRETITKYKNYNRCCYLLSNGKRCSRHAVGLTKVNNGKSVYVMQCKTHAPICRKKYVTYKSICARVINKTSNVKQLRVRKGGNLFNKIAMVKNCQTKRIDYPKTCMMGCIKDPGSKLSKSMMQKRMHQHDFITNKLKDMERLLLYGNRRVSSPKRVNNNINYKLKKK